jgi:hypothetical protein
VSEFAVKTKAEEVVEVVATDEVNVCEPVPEEDLPSVYAGSEGGDESRPEYEVNREE